MKTNGRKSKSIRLGTHGENYGNWMSAPVFYMVGALVVLMAVLCVISHFIPGMRLIGVLALIAAVVVLILLAWITWIRRQYAFGGGGMMEKIHEVLLSYLDFDGNGTRPRNAGSGWPPWFFRRRKALPEQWSVREWL